FYLKGVHEVGTIESFQAVVKNFPQTRPFNRLQEEAIIIKQPKDPYGRKLAKLEANWYKHHEKHFHNFLPQIYKYYPLTLKKLAGKPLYQATISITEKKRVLEKIVISLQAMHLEAKPKKST